MDEKNGTQKQANESLQKSVNDLRKKLDIEYGKLQNILNLKDDTEKWKINEVKLNVTKECIDDVCLKLMRHDTELNNLSSNVFDFSFKEMASNFDERVERLAPIKQQISELVQNVNQLHKSSRQENTSHPALETMQKMVENRLDCYTDSLNQKILNLSPNTSEASRAPLKVRKPSKCTEGDMLMMRKSYLHKMLIFTEKEKNDRKKGSVVL